MQTLYLRKREERRIRAGHLWVFSNEVDVDRSPLTAFEPGELAALKAANGHPLGLAMVNPGSLIAARILHHDPDTVPDAAFFAQRIRQALSLRDRRFDTPHYRVIFGESDRLPGLVVDRFGPDGEHLVVQTTTAGMDALLGPVVEALREVLAPAGILLRNDNPIRDMEQLPMSVEVVSGEVPDELEVVEAGLRFRVSARGGQKTGWFYDQRSNRDRLMAYLHEGDRVLDVFAYAGAWGIRAAAAGAGKVVCVDSSAEAIASAQANAERNGVVVETRQADAMDTLEAIAASGEHFDMVVLDPPAFIKRRKDRKAGAQAYQRLFQAGIRCVGDGGLLAVSSCSYHFGEADLLDGLRRALGRARREGRVLEIGGQGPDHPVHPAVAETRYLKTAFVALMPGQGGPGRVID